MPRARPGVQRGGRSLDHSVVLRHVVLNRPRLDGGSDRHGSNDKVAVVAASGRIEPARAGDQDQSARSALVECVGRCRQRPSGYGSKRADAVTSAGLVDVDQVARARRCRGRRYTSRDALGARRGSPEPPGSGVEKPSILDTSASGVAPLINQGEPARARSVPPIASTAWRCSSRTGPIEALTRPATGW